ncbi:MAG: MCE family protein, partial [Bacteroidetes bacterium]|nr:MCE family protein [Bacteroidota bacterium]
NNPRQPKAMKVSNETKIGALTAIAITLLILGFNFLKGKNLIEKKATMYIAFTKVNGLNMADVIKINGLKIGGVEDMQETDANLSGIVVAFHLTRAINIPNDTYAQVVTNPLGNAYIELIMGKSKTFLKDGFEGLPTFAPFDKILITCAAPEIPAALLQQLKIGGFIVLPLEDGHQNQDMVRITKISDTEIKKEIFGKFAFVPMLKGLVK